MVLIDHERQLLQRVKVTILYKVYKTAVFFYFVARYICSVPIILKCIMQTLWVIFVVYGNVTNVCCIKRQYCSRYFEKNYILSNSSSCIISFLFIHAKVDMALGHLQTQIFSWLWGVIFYY